eukprot:TRINITY_DN1991_c0_g2_i4.p1 TRINITY_DN1991_c0_g2~~TRINITY_DN1991_c0_g2_i4.p1  ORF type:complete len:309 (-),score=93.06 TRINITY_DN1991_c0_g2_i4:1119-2045(-)
MFQLESLPKSSEFETYEPHDFNNLEKYLRLSKTTRSNETLEKKKESMIMFEKDFFLQRFKLNVANNNEDDEDDDDEELQDICLFNSCLLDRLTGNIEEGMKSKQMIDEKEKDYLEQFNHEEWEEILTIAEETETSISLEEILKQSAKEMESNSNNEDEGDSNKSNIVQTDKYGFIIQPGEDNTVSRMNIKASKQTKQEKKWIQFLPQLNSCPLDKKRWRKRLRTGIPDKLRGEVWKRALNINALRDENPTLFQELLEQTTEFEHQIQIDLHRTFPRHIFFQEMGGQGQTSLYNVLKSYSIYNPKVGYC